VPAEPYRGIEPFRYEDHAIFFARDEETRLLANLVVVYRGVFLYGASGNGKSSLVNAGLLPQVRRLGFEAVRVRVQPQAGQELVVDELAIPDDDGEVMPFLFATGEAVASRVVLSVAEFEERLLAASAEHRPLIIFDQFEEILTLFDDAGGVASKLELTMMIGRLLRGSLPVKLLFAFREDYLAGIAQLLLEHPELVDRKLRLGPPAAADLAKIIRGPFEAFPGGFERELDEELAASLSKELAQRFGTGDVSLSEVQTVCLRLWRSPDPARLLADRKVQGLLEDELGEALDAFTPDVRAAAVAVLSEMVTSSGTRNVISAEDLRVRVRHADDQIPVKLIDEALERLESTAKLIRRERRRDVDLYEIISEFLVPWISERREEALLEKQHRRDELRREQERARDRRRLRIFGAIAMALLVVVAIVAALAVSATKARDEAESRTVDANSLALAGSAAEPLTSRPDISLGIAFEAYRLRQRPATSFAVRQSLLAARRSGLRGVLAADGGFLNDLAISPDGKVIAAASSVRKSNTVLLWNAATRARIGQLEGPRGRISAVAFSPDSRTLAAAGTDGMVRLWDVGTRALRASHRAGVGAINDVAFSPDGRSIAVAGYHGASLGRISAKATFKLLGGSRSTTAVDVAFSPDGRHLVSAGFDGLTAWNPAKIRDRGTLFGPGGLNSANFSPDGKRIVTAGTDGNIRVWAYDSGAQIGGAFTGHEGAAKDATFSADGKLVASAGHDGTVRIWDAANGTQLALLRGHIDDVSSVAFSPDGKLLVSAGELDSTVRLWNPATRTRQGVLKPDGDDPFDIAYSADGRTLAAVSVKSTSMWNPQMPARRRSLAPGTLMSAIAFKPGANVVAAASYLDGTIRLWNVATNEQIGTLASSAKSLDEVAFSRDGKTVAAAGEDGTVYLWRPPARKPFGRLRFGTQVTGIAFSPDGRTLAVAGAREAAALYDVAGLTRKGSLIGHSNYLSAIAFSPDGKLVATASSDRTVRLWDPSTLKQVGLLSGHTDAVRAVAFSPDGTIVASAGDDATVRLWDPQTSRSLGRLDGHSKAVNSVAFSPDGQTIASASADDTVRLWKEILWRDLRELRSTVCDALLTGISRADWVQHARDIPYRRSCP
jgi:WD40 repeat protein